MGIDVPEAADIAPSLSELIYMPVGFVILLCGIGLALNVYESWPASGTANRWRILPQRFADAARDSLPVYVSLVLLAMLAELGILAWWFADQNLIAVGHIAGTIFAAIVFILMIDLIGVWDGQRIQRRALEDASIELGVSVEELKTNEELAPRFLQLLSSRYSSELLRNRLSDLCGIIRTLWVWLGSLMQFGIFIVVLWYTFTDSPSIAVHAWWVLAVALSFLVINVAFSLLCRLLTGRYPGEAKEGRKFLVKSIREQRAAQNLDDENYVGAA